MTKLTWHFPTTDGGEEDGINDPGIETFEGNHERFVARESIQNSIDARKDKKQPARVHFERCDIALADIPGLDELRGVIERSQEYSKNQDNSSQLYGEAVRILKQKTVSVLKISDYNTIGLNGTDKDTSGGWYKLTRARGVNSMESSTGGGSFGIGKGASFAASGLRTVFYSTLNENGEHVFQGKAILSSFKNDAGDVRRGIGSLGEYVENELRSVRNSNDIPKFFRRSEQGTDVYIIGYKTEEKDWTQKLLNSILNNFWAAIHYDELDVELAENGKILHQIGEKNLGELMAEFAAGKKDSFAYYKAITESTIRKNAKLPNLGKVTLFVKLGEGLPKKVQMMRKSKMVVDTKEFRVLPEDYSAVFICNDVEGNKRLRALEPPAHDEWDPARNKEWGSTVYQELRKWVRQTLKEIAPMNDDTPEDVPGLNRWLPEFEEDDETAKAESSEGETSGQDSDKESGVELGAVHAKKKSEFIEPKKQFVAIKKNFGPGDIDKPFKGTGKSRKGKAEKVDNTAEGGIPRIEPSELVYRARELFVNGVRTYQLIISSEDVQKGSISIVASGGDEDYPVEIESVSDSTGQHYSVKGSTVKELSIDPKTPLKLFVTLKNSRRYVLGLV